MSHSVLNAEVLDYAEGSRTRTLGGHIGRLRKKLELIGLSDRIQTIRGQGYMWVSPKSRTATA